MDFKTNKKLIIGIIIAVIIVAIAGITAYMVTNQSSNTENMNVTLNSVQFTVPSSCSTVNDSGDGWSQYMSEKVCIISFCSKDAGLTDGIKYGTAFNILKGEFQTGAETVTVGNITLNKTSNGTYSYEYGDDSTHQNVLIVGTDKDVVASVVASMIYTGNDTGNATNSTNDTNSSSVKETSSSSSDSSSSATSKSSDSNSADSKSQSSKEYNDEYVRKKAEEYKEWQAAHPEIYGDQ